MHKILGRMFSLAKLALVGLLGQFCLAQMNSLEGVRVHDAPNYTRVVFDTRSEVNYQVFMLETPNAS